MASDNDYACDQCNGHGEVECFQCGGDMDCEACDGSGLDADKLDVRAFVAAERILLDRDKSTWEWREGGQVLGRMSANGRLAYGDFPPK